MLGGGEGTRLQSRFRAATFQRPPGSLILGREELLQLQNSEITTAISHLPAAK